MNSSDAPPPVLTRSTSVGEAHPSNRGRALAAADHGEALRRGDGFGDRTRTRRERCELEHAHRAVPEDGGGAGELVGVDRRGLGSDVEALPTVGIAPAGTMRVSASAVASRAITMSTGICTRPVSSTRRHSSTISGCTSESPTLYPCASEERERHRAADEHGVAAVEQRVDHAELVADLRAAEHRDERASGAVEQTRQHLDLADEQASAGVRQDARRADDRGVLAMRRAERLVHVDVGELGRGWCRTRGRTRSRRARSGGSRACTTSPGEADATSGCTRGPTTAGAKQHLAPEQLAEPRRDRRHRVARIGLALRTSEVPARDDDRVPVAQPLDRGRARW